MTGTSNRSRLDCLLRPGSIAIAGASDSPGSLGGGVLINLTQFGYSGDIYPINPRLKEIDGRACIASANELPVGVDCAVIAIPIQHVLTTLQACGERGVKSAIVFSGGFSEAGDEGRALQQELIRIADKYDMLVEGPNCLGMINYVHRIPITFGSLDTAVLTGPGVGIVSQSGAMAAVLRSALAARDVRTSYCVSTGNEAVTEVSDYLEFLIDDEQTDVIVLVVEQFRNPQKFLKLAELAREKNKAVLLLHPGRSAAAQISAQTHTGAMTGDYAVMQAMVEHAGVRLLATLEELIDLAELFVRCPAPPVAGPLVMTDSGAFKAMVLDYCEGLDFALAAVSESLASDLRGVLPDFIPPTNPLDLTAQALVDPDLYRRALEPMLTDDGCGSIVLAVILSSEVTARRKVVPIIDAIKALAPDKPIIFAMLGDEAPVPGDLIDGLRETKTPFFRSPERAFRALKQFKPLPQKSVFRHGENSPPSIELPSGMVAEYSAKQILQKLGISIPQGAIASTSDEAVAIAHRIGYPVAIKAQSDALAHKTEAGGVALNLRDAAQIRSAWAEMHKRIAASHPALALDGILVEKMAKPGLEIILGARNDAQWGPVILIGLGGIWTEALHDARLVPASAGQSQFEHAIASLRGAALLGPLRGQPPRDVRALVKVAMRLAALVLSHPEITEIDVNPLMLYSEGEGAVALDALIVTRPPPRDAR